MNDRQQDDDILPRNLDLSEGNEPVSSSTRANHSRKRFIKPVAAMFVLLLAIGIGIWLWLFLFGGDTNEFAGPDQEEIERATEIDTEEDIPAPDGFETIRHDNPRLELTLPESWELTKGDDDIHIESPEFSITTANGETIENAVFRLYFRQGARENDSKYIGQGLAAIPSKQITYAEPARGQREDTMLSFFGQNATDHIAFLFVAGNFELEVGEALGPDYGQEETTYIIAGGYSADELNDDLNMYPVKPNFFQSTDEYEQALDIIKSLRLL